MSGDIFLKEQSVATITSTGASITNGTAVSAGTVDTRTSGTANLIQSFVYRAGLTCQWATVTGIAQANLIADLYFVPLVDGTNAVDIDTSGGTSFIPGSYRVGSFYAAKAPTTSTDMRFATANEGFMVKMGKYTAYLLNRSGQTISSNWTLLIDADRAQYS